MGSLVWLMAGAHHRPACDPLALTPPARQGCCASRPVEGEVREAELERTRWDPKDGELCLGRLRPGETLVEGRSDSDVQIDRRTWV